MNRLQKKCMIVSLAAHGLLAGVLFFGPGFRGPKPEEDFGPILTLMPDRIIEENISGGGDPKAGAPTPTPPAQSPPSAPVKLPSAQPEPPTTKPPETKPAETKPPEPKPPEPKPDPVREPAKEPEPPAPKPKVTKPEKKPDEPVQLPEDPNGIKITRKKPPETKKEPTETEPRKNQVKVDLSKVTRKYPADIDAERRKAEAAAKARAEAKAAADAKAAAEADAARRKAIADRATAFQGSIAQITTKAQGRTVVGVFGSGTGTTVGVQGPGGEYYAGFRQVVHSTYFRAWAPPDELSDENASAEAQVTIAKDGSVVRESTFIKRKSGVPALDKSVQAALDRVRFVAPFPEGATDSQRTFILNFSPKLRRLMG